MTSSEVASEYQVHSHTSAEIDLETESPQRFFEVCVLCPVCRLRLQSLTINATAMGKYLTARPMRQRTDRMHSENQVGRDLNDFAAMFLPLIMRVFLVPERCADALSGTRKAVPHSSQNS